jgi:hypothetical protein
MVQTTQVEVLAEELDQAREAPEEPAEGEGPLEGTVR